MAAERKFRKEATFEIPNRGEGSVRVGQSGEVRLELPGRFVVESVFPGMKKGPGAVVRVTLRPVED
jgi:hypothetical protein